MTHVSSYLDLASPPWSGAAAALSGGVNPHPPSAPGGCSQQPARVGLLWVSGQVAGDKSGCPLCAVLPPPIAPLLPRTALWQAPRSSVQEGEEGKAPLEFSVRICQLQFDYGDVAGSLALPRSGLLTLSHLWPPEGLYLCLLGCWHCRLASPICPEPHQAHSAFGVGVPHLKPQSPLFPSPSPAWGCRDSGLALQDLP